jgi:tRNA G37 N-methylase Trm5
VQLALNGARSVHAIDIDRRAVANTLANAFRNGVADRVTGAVVDLYPWVPEASYDIVVASLWQMPTDPFERPTSHRPLDFWVLDDDVMVAYLLEIRSRSEAP